VCSRNKIFVGSLPPNITKEDLHLLFLQFGDIKELTVVPPRPNRPASAFVEFVDEKAAGNALTINGSKPFRSCIACLEVRFADQRVDGVIAHK
jgi:RNA recognition motif-containing protein